MARFARAWLPLLLLLGACGSGVEAGVNVKSVATDLVYGIPEENVPAAPANIGSAPSQPIGVILDDADDDDLTPSNPPPPPSPPCPKAPVDDFPDPAQSAVKGQPEEGEYQWVVNGTENTATIGKVNLRKFARRQITGVLTTESGATQWTVSEPDLRFGSRTIVKTTYQVRPDDGIFITRIRRESDGGAESEFRPTPAVEILPLPAQLGTEINSTGIDPNTLEIMHVTGSVPKRHRVDACGKIVDSFYIDGSQEFISTSGESVQRNYDYGVATAFGGQIVYEKIEAPCQGQDESGACVPEPTLDFVTHLGQTEPDEIR